jgi:hypothetical protein
MITTRSVIDESALIIDAKDAYRPMIESLIQNFKCFADLSVRGLGKVNVVVGDNASGKTALLEAAYLSQLTSPQLVQKTKTWRGMGPSAEFPMNREGYESQWKNLFFEQKQGLAIELEATGNLENTRKVRAFYDTKATIEVTKDDDSPAADSSAIIPIVFEVTDSAGVVHSLMGPMGPFVIQQKQPSPLNSQAAFYPSTYATAVPAEEATKQFADMDVMGSSDFISQAVQDVFPRVSNLSPAKIGGAWLLFCKVPELREKIPVHQVSSGIHKLIALLAGIAAQENGAVMIDEIDNGFYFKVLPKVWEVLHRVASHFKVQLIVSTHSREGLQAILPTLRKAKEDFRLIRVEIRGKKHVAKVFGGKDFEAALETETEVR